MQFSEMASEDITMATGHPPAPSLSDAQIACFKFNYYVAIVTAVFAVLCVIGNGLTLPTFTRQAQKSGQSPTIFLFQALAVADLLVIIPFTILGVYPDICRVTTQMCGPCWTFHHRYLPWLLAYFWPLGPMAQVSSVWITVSVTYHRYRAVCTPFVIHSGNVKPMTLAYIHVIVICIFSVTYNLSRFWEFYVISDVDQHNNSIYRIVHSELFNNRYYQFFFKSLTHTILMNIIPLVIISVLTFRLVRTLRQSSETRQGLTSSARALFTRAQKDRSLTFLLIGIVIIFIICQVPTTANRILTTFIGGAMGCGDGWLWFFVTISNLLVNINSSVNFFVYTSCSSAFRYHLKLLLTCGRGTCCGKQVVSAGGSISRCSGSQMVSANVDYKIKVVSRCPGSREEESFPSSSGIHDTGMEGEDGDVMECGGDVIIEPHLRRYNIKVHVVKKISSIMNASTTSLRNTQPNSD